MVNIWNAFHDGTIVSMTGTIPGDVEALIEAKYLRERFPESGKHFVVHLMGCSFVSFVPFDGGATRVGLNALANPNLEILSAKVKEDEIHVVTTTGILILNYKSVVLSLDTGRLIDISDVAAAGDQAVIDLRAKKTSGQ